MGVCRERLKKLITLPRRAANAYGSLQATGVCRGWEFAGGGSLQGMGVCRGWEFAEDGSLQGMKVCRGWEFAGDGSLQGMGVKLLRDF